VTVGGRRIRWPGLGVSAAARPPAVLLGTAILVSILVLAPFAATLLDAFQGGMMTTLRLLLRPIMGRLLLNTLGLAVVTTVSCAIIGIGLAWLVERTDLPGRRLLGIAAPLSLAIPAFIASYAWLSLSNVFAGVLGAALVVTCAYFPLVYLPVAAALRSADPALEESARTLGCGPWRCFFRVTLPQLRPALFGGMLLVVMHVLGEFGAFALLRFRTFTTAIYAQYTAGFGAESGALMACVLLLLGLLCLYAEQRLRGRHDYARTGRGARRPPMRYPLGRLRYPALAAALAALLVTLGVPLATIGYWLTQHDAAAVATTAVSVPQLLYAALHSFGYGLAAGLVTTGLAFPIAYLSIRYRSTLSLLMERATYLPRSMPGIVIALALVSLSLAALYPLYQTAALLVIAYAIMFMPLAVVSLRSTLIQVQPNLPLTARTLGSRPLTVFRRITLPLAAPGFGAAAALVFIAVSTELTTTLLLVPTGVHTLATQVWAASSTFAFAAAAPYAAVLVTLSMAATWLLAQRFGRAPIDNQEPCAR